MSKFNIGDKARVIDGNEYHGFEIGSVVTIIEDDGSHIPYRCRDEKGTTRWMVADHLAPLEPAPPAPTIPDEIEINGETYRRVVKAAEPEKPETQAGQVWRSGRNFFVLTDDFDACDGERRCGNIATGRSQPTADHIIRKHWEYIAPSLADAFERGLITAADLR